MIIVNSTAEDSCEKNQQRDAILNDPAQHEAIEPGTLEAKGNRDAENNFASSDSNSDLNDAQPTNASEVSYPEGGMEAWLVVFGSFCAMGVVFGLINTSAVFEAYFKENQLKDYSHSQIGWIFSLNLFLVFFVGVQIGPIFDRHGPRALVAAGSGLCVLSLMLLSLSTQYYQIILTYSVMGGIGGALLNCPAYSAIAHFFNQRRGLATGLATTAGGVGGIIFPLLLQFLLGENGVGFAWTCRIMGFILLGLCVFANLFIRSRLEVLQAQNQAGGGSVWPDFKILRNRGFAMAAAGIFFMEYGLFVPLTYIISYAKSHGNGDTDSSVLLSLLNAGSVVGRALPGLLADKLGRFNVIIMTISLCATTILALWVPAGDSKALLTVFCVFFGFASGSNLSLIPVCLGQFCDLKDYGRYYSTATMMASFGTLSSVPIGGALLGVGSLNTGWLALMLFSGVAYIVALSCFTYARVSVTGWKFKAKF